jgi:hypothetical protein
MATIGWFATPALAAVCVVACAGSHVAAPTDRARAAATLPTAKEVVARYDQALGGREAILRHTSSTMRGDLEVRRPQSVVKVPFVFLLAAPYLRLERYTLPSNQGEAVSGFDGRAAWSFDPRSGPELATGTDRESVKRDADFYYALDELSWFKSMATIGVEDFEGQTCYRLHGINNWDKSNDQFYDRETGLLAGYEFESQSGGAPGAEPSLTHEIFSDYRDVDGVRVAMKRTVKIRSKGGDWKVVQVLSYASVTFNDVDPGAFTPPKPVQELLAKEQEKANEEKAKERS